MVMVRYFYVWTPVVVVFGTAILLTIPYLALIALVVVLLAVLATVAWAIAAVPYRLARAIGRHRQSRRGAPRHPEFRKEAVS